MAWPKWLVSATIPEIFAALTEAFDREHLYNPVHVFDGHLRTTEG